MKTRLIFAAILTFYSLSSFGQLFDSGQNPPRVKFRQISTQNFQVIYPAALEEEAQRMAATLEHILPHVARNLGRTPRKISIILQNQTVESNGFVQLAPRRSEFYTTPPQNDDYQEWLSGLAVHELRHVVQFDRLTGELKRPFFEGLALAFFGITLPPWLYEGDAVVTESTLTNGGRGAIPSWDLIFRTNTLSLKKYSYVKNFLGSVKDNTPGYYQLGYFMNARLRREFGSGILDSIFSRIRRNPFRPYNLSRSLRHFTGMTTRSLHDSTVAELERLWRDQYAEIPREEYVPMNRRTTSFPLDYWLPAAMPDGSVLALKEGRPAAPSIVRIDTSGREETVVRIGLQKDPHFHFSAGKIVWDEVRSDPRFRKRSYNVICVLDLASGRRKQLTRKTRLFAPALSPDGSRIAAVSVSYKNEISVVELDAGTGAELRRFAAPGNLMLQTPSYHSSGDRLVMTAVRNGTAILELDLATGEFTERLPLRPQQIARPVYAGNDIAFKAHFSGVDNIFLLGGGEPIPEQLSFAEFGAFNPSFDAPRERVLFNFFRAEGHDIGAAELRQKMAIPVGDTFVDYSRPVRESEGTTDILKDIPETRFPSRPFRETRNLFYFHTATVTARENGYLDDYNFGLSLLSNNKLNTMDVSVGYEYNQGLRSGEFRADVDYKKFFPVFSLSYVNQPRLIYQRQQTGSGTVLRPVTWRENVTEFNMSVPLSFSRYNHFFGASFLVGTSHTSRYAVSHRPGNFIGEVKFPLRYTASLSHNLMRSAMELAPRFGQNVTLSYRHFPLDGRLSGHLFTLKSRLYFPGLARLHSFQAGFNYQTNSGTYDSVVDIPYIRGFSHLPPAGNVNNNLQLDYRFPLFYPDLELGPLAYVKRIRGGLFADYQNLGRARGIRPATYGVSLQSDFNLLRFYLPNFAIGTAMIFSTAKSVQNPIFDLSFSYSY